jgi:hypothetical protein
MKGEMRPVGTPDDDAVRSGPRGWRSRAAAAFPQMEQSAGALADGRLAAGLDETEQRPTRDAGRGAAAPLKSVRLDGPDSRLIRTSLVVCEHILGSRFAQAKRTPPLVEQGARCSSIALVYGAPICALALVEKAGAREPRWNESPAVAGLS